MENGESRSKIFINPDFKKAHFNPNFLPKATVSARPDPSPVEQPIASTAPLSSIHFNPAFLEKLRIQRQQEQLLSQNHVTTLIQQKQPLATVGFPSSPPNPIIQNTKRKLIRASSARPIAVTPSEGVRSPLLAPLVKISKNKLVRSVPAAPAKSPVAATRSKPFKPNHQDSQLYKLDRRPGRPGTIRKSIIKRYSLIRTNSISPQKVVVTDRRLLKLRRPRQFVGSNSFTKTSTGASFPSPNKKLVMLYINGLFYKSSSNKLQVSRIPGLPSTTQQQTASSSSSPRKQERCLTIRGARFLLDSSGTKLRKVPSTTTTNSTVAATEPNLRRIDIGGLTYLPKKDGTFERTDNHRTRTYLNLAKQKSIQLLTSKMRTCNVPCPIFRRLGKCAAFLKGRCPKVHDPKHVTICPRFLKGECSQDDCLLSHNVSLEKMPVCRFFLEARCVNDSCPYLHKKVSEKEQVCEDFLRGFCPLAAKCQRRHEFICPEFDRLGACARTKCPYPHKSKAKPAPGGSKQIIDSSSSAAPSVSIEQQPTSAMQRYYFDHSSKVANSGQCGEDSDKLNGDEEVQLKRLLGKVEKMKQGHLKPEKPCDRASEAGGASVKQCEDVKSGDKGMEIDEDSDEDDDEAVQRPPVLRRAKLGPLPSFIPI